MRVVNGIHISNSRHWDVEQAIRVARPEGAVTILHHLMFARDEVADQWGDVENRFWYGKLRYGFDEQEIDPAPRRLIHVRLYHPNWRELDPAGWAEHAVRMLDNWTDGHVRTASLLDDPYVAISPANEQNIEPHVAHSVADYQAIGLWNSLFWEAFDGAAPGHKCLRVWSALAFGHEPPGYPPDGEYQVPEIRAAINRCDIMASHPYCYLNWGADGQRTAPGGDDEYWYMLRDFRPRGFKNDSDPGGMLAQFPDKPLLITEAGTWTHSHHAKTDATETAMTGLLMAAAQSGRVLGVTWFIWNSGPEHGQNVIWENEGLRRRLENMADFTTKCEVPRVDPDPDPEPEPEPEPEPNPTPTRQVFAMTEVRRRDGWWSIARRLLDCEPTRDDIEDLRAANPGIGALHTGVWIRSPWHVAVRVQEFSAVEAQP